MKDKIQNKNGLNVLVDQKGADESSRIFCDKIEFINNHLMFRNKENLVFKVWLKDKKFKDINEALKSVGIKVSL